MMPRISVADAGSTNRLAFLDMLAFSEIGPRLLAISDDGYDVLVGSTPQCPMRFDDYNDHPNMYVRAQNSTAAGRYQILWRYWVVYRAQLRLPDFSPLSQDKYALNILREQRALNPIDEGRFGEAVARVRNIWASLPGAGYGQHENALESLAQAYRDAGGTMEE